MIGLSRYNSLIQVILYFDLIFLRFISLMWRLSLWICLSLSDFQLPTLVLPVSTVSTFLLLVYRSWIFLLRCFSAHHTCKRVINRVTIAFLPARPSLSVVLLWPLIHTTLHVIFPTPFCINSFLKRSNHATVSEMTEISFVPVRTLPETLGLHDSMRYAAATRMNRINEQVYEIMTEWTENLSSAFISVYYH